MSKFDDVLNRISEALPAVNAQNQQKWDPQTGLPLNQAAMAQWNKMPEAERKKREQGADTYHNQLLAQPQQAQPAQQQNPQQQQQAIQQAAKLLNLDPKALQQILDAQKQQQKPAAV